MSRDFDARTGDLAARHFELRQAELSAIWGEDGARVILEELKSSMYVRLMAAQEAATLSEVAARLRGKDSANPILFGPCSSCGRNDAPVAWTSPLSRFDPEPVCLRCGRRVIEEFKEAKSAAK